MKTCKTMSDGNYIRFNYGEHDYVLHAWRVFDAENPREDDRKVLSYLVLFDEKYGLGDHHYFRNQMELLNELLSEFCPEVSNIYEMQPKEKLHVLLSHSSDFALEPICSLVPDSEAVEPKLFRVEEISVHTPNLYHIGWAVLEKDAFLDAGYSEEEWCSERAHSIISDEFNRYRAYVEDNIFGYTLFEVTKTASGNENLVEVLGSSRYFGADILSNGIDDIILGLRESVESGEYTEGECIFDDFPGVYLTKSEGKPIVINRE